MSKKKDGFVDVYVKLTFPEAIKLGVGITCGVYLAKFMAWTVAEIFYRLLSLTNHMPV